MGDTKTCSRCGKTAGVEEFAKKGFHKNGTPHYRNVCRVCYPEFKREYNGRNPDQVAWVNRRQRTKRAAVFVGPPRPPREKLTAEERAEKQRRRYQTDPEYRAKQSARFAEKRAKRRAKEKLAAPAWADKERLAEIYLEARKLREAGMDVHVDHIIPINGETVTGLHVPENLRIIPAQENIAKSNKVLPELLDAA